MRPVLFFAGLVLLLAACASAAGAPQTPLETGKQVYLHSCAVCHGDQGQGGVGRPLSDVMATFPDCAAQMRWITLGSVRWQDEVGPTYGAGNKVVEGVMPSFDNVLTSDEIRSVAIFVRVRFGGASESGELSDCSVG